MLQTVLPQGAWDVHHHVFDPEEYPYSPTRHLTPPRASVEHYEAFKRSLGITNSALVHGLSYGHDTAPLKSFLTSLGRNQTAGVAVITRATTDAEINDLHAHGVRGIRLDLYSEGAMYDLEKQIEMLQFYSDRIAPWHWSLGFLQLNLSNWEALGSIIPDLPVDVVVDHHALLKAESMLPPASQVLEQPGLGAIVKLLKGGNFWVKLSAPYRCSEQAPHYEDMKPLVRCLVNANPRRVVWGSDWPHTPRMKVRSREEALKEAPYLEVDDAAWLKSLRSWLSDEEWHLLMVENPSNLFQR